MTLQAKLLLRDIESAEEAITHIRAALKKSNGRHESIALTRNLALATAWLESLEKEFAIVKNF